jgi:hypothetical protein
MISQVTSDSPAKRAAIVKLSMDTCRLQVVPCPGAIPGWRRREAAIGRISARLAATDACRWADQALTVLSGTPYPRPSSGDLCGSPRRNSGISHGSVARADRRPTQTQPLSRRPAFAGRRLRSTTAEATQPRWLTWPADVPARQRPSGKLRPWWLPRAAGNSHKPRL